MPRQFASAPSNHLTRKHRLKVVVPTQTRGAKPSPATRANFASFSCSPKRSDFLQTHRRTLPYSEFLLPMCGRFLAGVDEAGRGPIAGPVVAACVLVREPFCLEGVRDSKTLSEGMREQLFERIRREAIAWSVGIASPREIEQLNILRASLLAMRRALQALPLNPHQLLVDGKFPVPDCPVPQEAIIDGDARHPVISAASIVAKVVRDRMMRELDRLYPAYGFAQHKGYPTPAHLRKLECYGACAQHRRTYMPLTQLRLRMEETG